MDEIFDHNDAAEKFAESIGYRKMAISLLLDPEELAAIVDGKFIVRHIEGIGVVIGKEESFEREHMERMRKIKEQFDPD